MLGAGGAPSSAGVFVSEEGSLRADGGGGGDPAVVETCCNAAVARVSAHQGRKAWSTSIRSIAFLQEQANPEMTAFETRRWLMQGAVGWGNGYAVLEWSRGGRLLNMWPMIPGSNGSRWRAGVLVTHTIRGWQTVFCLSMRCCTFGG